MLLALLIGLCAWAAGVHPAAAERARASAKHGAKRSKASCLRELRRLGVRFREVQRRGIDIAVRVTGDIGGVTYKGYAKGKPLDLDCSLVVSLAHMGPYLNALGITRATYSSSYQRRRVRGSKRWSRHSFGLALDVHAFTGDDLGVLSVRDDYEQGLGDNSDCVGQPLTQGGAILRALYCQLERSGGFHSILTPDYDAGHYNHFHIEAEPWVDRQTVAPPAEPLGSELPIIAGSRTLGE